MRRRALVLASLLVVVIAAAVPVVSPWRIRGGRSRCAEEHLTDLSGPSALVRDRAERALVSMGPGALPVLAEIPDDATAEARLRADRAARTIRRAANLERDPDRRRLVEALADGLLPPADALDRLGPTALPSLVAAARQRPEDPAILALAVDHAGRHGGPGAARFLVRILSTGDVPAETLALAARGLAIHGSARDATRLLPLLDDPAAARRAAVARTVLALGTPRDRERVASLVVDPSPFVRIACADLLVESETRDTVRPLLEDAEPRVREEAVRALARARDPEALDDLRRGLQDASYRVRIAAVDTLAAAGRADEVAALRGDPSVGVRLAVRRAASPR